MQLHAFKWKTCSNLPGIRLLLFSGKSWILYHFPPGEKGINEYFSDVHLVWVCRWLLTKSGVHYLLEAAIRLLDGALAAGSGRGWGSLVWWRLRGRKRRRWRWRWRWGECPSRRFNLRLRRRFGLMGGCCSLRWWLLKAGRWLRSAGGGCYSSWCW